MAPVKQKEYRFSPKSITELRERLGLSQAKLARSLGIPQNTLSRWEIGTTTPDAKSLAAIYSFAIENGITPSFFRKRKREVIKRTRLLVVWDFSDFTPLVQYLPNFDAWLRAECEKRFPTTTQRTFKAFFRATPWLISFGSADTLLDRGWKVWEEGEDLAQIVIDHCKGDCGQDPSSTILVLVARDGDYADMVNEIKSRDARVHLFGFGCSQELINAVGERRFNELPWPDNSPRISVDPSYHPWLEQRVIG